MPSAPQLYIIPPKQPSGGSLKIAANQLKQDTVGSPDAKYWAVVSQALALAQSQLDALNLVLRQPLPQSTSSSSTPGGGSTPYIIPNIGNTFTPDFSQGSIQYVLLVANSVLENPVNAPLGVTFPWTLIIDQDASGGHNLATSSQYFFNANLLGTAAISTRSTSNWQSGQSGNCTLSQLPVTDQPIP